MITRRMLRWQFRKLYPKMQEYLRKEAQTLDDLARKLLAEEREDLQVMGKFLQISARRIGRFLS